MGHNESCHKRKVYSTICLHWKIERSEINYMLMETWRPWWGLWVYLSNLVITLAQKVHIIIDIDIDNYSSLLMVFIALNSTVKNSQYELFRPVPTSFHYVQWLKFVVPPGLWSYPNIWGADKQKHGQYLIMFWSVWNFTGNKRQN